MMMGNVQSHIGCQNVIGSGVLIRSRNRHVSPHPEKRFEYHLPLQAVIIFVVPVVQQNLIIDKPAAKAHQCLFRCV